ncbi:MAG: efflux RND transporter periplasmic adaptor subunit [Acidobacteriia bacterium]|nr:efflux RND transporter periplasmic adaptor subunit [Terriglobia bacterium]
MKTLTSTGASHLISRHRRLRILGLLFILALGVWSAFSCSKRSEATGAYEHEKEAVEPTLFTVPQNQLAHLSIVPVQTANWSVDVHTTGTVDWDVNHTTQAITQVNGPIARILVDAGSFVKAGQPLLYVSSPDIASAIATYRKAKNRLNLAKITLDRSRDLLAHHAIAQKDFEAVQADYNDAATEVQSDLQPLKIFGVTAKEIEEAEKQGLPINPQLPVRAPISGMVVQKLVFPGQLIQAGATTCFVISDVSTVWVQGHLYEKDLTSVHVGDSVVETNASIPTVFHGVVAYIGAMLDPATRTTPVRIVTRNPGGILKKDMFVDAVIHTKTLKDVLTAPASAVLHDDNNRPFVYVQMDGGKFAQRLIDVGAQQDGQVAVRSGLKAGDRIVAEGSVFLQFANSTQQ